MCYDSAISQGLCQFSGAKHGPIPHTVSPNSAWPSQTGVFRVLGGSRWAGEAGRAPELINCQENCPYGMSLATPSDSHSILGHGKGWKIHLSLWEHLAYPKPTQGQSGQSTPTPCPYAPSLHNSWPDQHPDPLGCLPAPLHRKEVAWLGPPCTQVSRTPCGISEAMSRRCNSLRQKGLKVGQDPWSPQAFLSFSIIKQPLLTQL